MKLDELKGEHIEKVFEIYGKLCLGIDSDPLEFITRLSKERAKQFKYDRTGEIIQDMKNGGTCYRVGSKWDSQSKVCIYQTREGGIKATFEPNFAPDQRKGKAYKSALKAGEKFSDQVTAYFNSISK